MRGLSNTFFNDLKTGLLEPILRRVKQDDTLMLAIRDAYINIYYRGGNLLKVEANINAGYKADFDTNYNIAGQPLPELPSLLYTPADVTAWISAFPYLKEMMDFFFSAHPKPEREFQQLVARENNHSCISNETEYFISDIEFADPTIGARFDMLAIRWLASGRKDWSNCRPALIEMKYGDNALGGSAGLIKHLDDMENLLANGSDYKFLLETMTLQFNQLDQLGLLQFNHCSNGTNVVLSDDKPEVIFLLSNHNPRSSKLFTILNDPKLDNFAQSSLFDLRFYMANFSGYGMHCDCMLTLPEFRRLVGR